MEDDESIQSPMDKEAREEDSEYSAESHSEKNDQPTVNEVMSSLFLILFLRRLLSRYHLFPGQN